MISNFACGIMTGLNERVAELEKTCKSRSDTIIEYSNKIAELEEGELARCAEESEKQSEYEGEFLDRIAELEKERDKYKSYFDSVAKKYFPANKHPETKKPNKGM